jgi:hypothetical protein
MNVPLEPNLYLVIKPTVTSFGILKLSHYPVVQELHKRLMYNSVIKIIQDWNLKLVTTGVHKLRQSKDKKKIIVQYSKG